MTKDQAKSIADEVNKRCDIDIINTAIESIAKKGEYQFVSNRMIKTKAIALKIYYEVKGFDVEKYDVEQVDASFLVISWK